MKFNIPNIIILTDSYNVSHFHAYDSEITKEITDKSRKILTDLSERLLASAPKPMIIIDDVDSIFDKMENSQSPGFTGLDELLGFFDGK